MLFCQLSYGDCSGVQGYDFCVYNDDSAGEEKDIFKEYTVNSLSQLSWEIAPQDMQCRRFDSQPKASELALFVTVPGLVWPERIWKFKSGQNDFEWSAKRIG